MATLDELLRQAAAVDGYGVAASQGTDAGLISASQAELDLRSLTPNQLRRRYGNAAASHMLGSLQRGMSARQADLNIRDARTTGQATYDTATGLGAGFVGGLGGLGALGVGLINEDAGTWLGKKVQQGMQWVESTQSDGVNAARRLQRTDTAIDARDNTKLMELEIEAGYSDLTAGLRRVGRDTVDAIANSITDPVMLGQGTSEAVGSLLAGGPISKGLKAIGAAIMAGGRASGLLSRTAAASADDSAAILGSLSATERPLIGAVGTGRIARGIDRATWPLATAGLESGGAYSGAVSQIMEMDFPELMKTSPTFRELVEGGMSPEEARVRTANRAGLFAAAVQAPFAAATGTLTRFAETPLRVPSLGSGLRNVLVNEPLEEAVQSGTGGLAQNLAVKRYGDENLSLTEGLGEQIAQGALYGFTAAGTVQAPGMALQGTKEAVRSAVRAGKSVARANRDRAREILRAAEAKSEVGSETVAKAAAEVVDSMGTVAPAVTAAVDALDIKDEQKQEVKDYLSKVEAALSFDGPALMEQQGLPREAADALFPNVTNRVDAVMTAAARLAAAKTDEEVLAWGGTLHNIMEPLQEVAAMDIEAMSELPDSAVEALRTYQNVLNTIEDADVMREGLAKFREHMASMEQAPITEEEIATPQGQARAQATVAAASLDPLSVNEEVVKTVLDHAKAGRIQLTPENRRALNISLGLLGAVREMEAKASANGLAPKNPISENILTGNDPAYGAQQSANQHLHELRRAIRGGNAALARGVLDVFGEFVQHMGRKVEALNKHLDTFGQKGRPAYIPYVAYNPETGETYMSDSATDSRHKGMFVEPTNAASVRLAQTMALEYETLNKVFNTLVSAMPELKVKPLPMVELNPELTGKVDEVVKKFQLKKAGVSKIEELVPEKVAQPKQEAKATPKKAEPKKVKEAPKQGELELQPAKVEEPAPAVSRVTKEQAQRLSDEGLNKRLEALIEKRQKKEATPEDEATFAVLDAEMNVREDAAAQQQQQEEAASVEQAPSVSNKEWMSGTRRDIRPDNGRARMKVGDTTISYDRDDDGIRINLITTPKEARGKGSARRAMNAFLQATDAAGLPVSLSVAEQDATTNRDALVKFYSSFGFVPTKGDGMTRAVGAEPVAAAPTAPVEQVTEAKQDPAPVPKDIPEFEPNEKNLATRVAKAYPKLVKHVRNMFTQLFDMPKEPQTRIWDYESPAQALYDAVSQGEEGIEDFGVKLRFPIKPETLDSFADLLRPNPESPAVAAAVVKRGRAINAKEARTLANVKGVVQVMQYNLRKALNERYFKKGDDERTVADVFASGQEVNRATRFKGLNITEQTESGNFVYNQTLAEAAVLAGFNWALTMGRTVQDRDPEQIAKITGLAEEVQGNAADALKQGFTATEMANALVPMIKRYWNVRDPRNDKQAYADPAYLDGVPTAVAMEVLRAMEQIGLLHRHEAVISDPELGIDRTFYVFEPVIDDNPLYDYPELIEELVAIKPEVSLYFGDERAPVPDTKLNTEGVPNTKEDKAAIKAANDTPYFFNLENFEMFRHFTETDFMEIFGGGVLTDENKDEFNVMHAMSVRGRNNNVISGWRAINILGSRLQNYAKDGSLEDVAIHFAHNMSSVSRLQQLGGMTPQGNKLVREIILPTKATVDLTDARKRLLFDLAVAQGLEIKIHKLSPDESTAALNKLLSNELAPAMAAFDTWLKDKSKPLDHKAVAEALRAAGKDVTPLAFHVLKEAARLNQTKDRSAFQTSVYIEADGVTNGVIMAQFLMSIGGFTKDQVRNLMMGGVAFGPAQTMADLHPKNGGEDLYTVAAKKGEQNLIGQLRQIRAQKNRRYVEPHQMAVLDLLQEFLPGVKIVPGDNGSMVVQLDRSFSKNPMTVTLYGSSPNGIANKITSLLLDEVYARATTGTIPKKAMEHLNLLMSGRLTFNKKKGEYYVNNNSSAETINFKNPLSLQLNVEQFRQLQANIQEGIVQPLRAGIEETLGSDMMDSVTRIRKAMQIQSIFYEQMFRKRVNEAIEYRKKNDPSYKQGDHLSRTDLEKIRKELENIAPWFRTANQTMLINKFSFLRNGYNYGRSLVDGDEGYRPFAQTLAPINSGVAAIPYLNIGLGDGQTIQRAWASGQEVFRRALPVFDGVNLSLNDIDAASEVLNSMVMEAGMTNPHLAVMTTFNTFLSESDNIAKVIEGFYSDLQSENKRVSDAAKEALKALDFALGNPSESYKVMDADAYIGDFERLSASLKEATLSVETRHRVMKSVSMSIDQFAAVGKPYQSKGEELAADLSQEAVAEELNKRYIAESVELSKLLEAPKDPLPGAVVTDDTVARVYSSEMINELVKNAVLSPIQTETLAAVMPGLADYTVFAGTPGQINNTLASLGKDTINFIRADGAVRNGIIDIDAKTIYLVNQDPEVLVHELVHAATFDTVLRYYRGEKLSPDATAAIQRLEVLLEQFQGMRVTKAMTAEQREAMNNAKLEIDNARTNPQRDEATNKAAALNEFMAWATTNNALAERLGKIRAKPLARLVGAVIDAIKSLLRLPKSDMLSNVVFNTGIVAMENTTLSQLVTSVTMDHATNGAPTHLVELRKRLLRNIVSHLDTLPEGKQLKGVLPFWRPMVMGKMVSKDFQNVFGLSQAEASVLEMVVATLATNMELDTTALGQAQALYQHVLEHLTVESFMDPKAADQEAERFYATQKFNLVTGKTGRMMDKDERSSLMATFLGMGMVSLEFQAVMAKLPQMKTKDSRDGTFDQRLAFEAERALNNLGEIIAGQRSKAVDTALASLAHRVFESESEQRGLLRDSVNGIYKWLDRGNDFLVDGLGKLSDWGAKKGMAMHESGSTAAARAAGAALGLAAGAIHKDRAEQQAEVAVSWANKLKLPPTMMRLITDVVGRTGSNANLYDRIKLLRSSIQALRQHFRTDVPRELLNSFTKRPTEAEWTAMTLGLAKTDFAALGTYGTAKEVARLVTSKTQRDRAIASLEQSLQQADPQHFSMYQEKAKQLADYMNGKSVGPNLLTNADAISLLPNMPKRTRWKRPDAAFVEQLDQLITLYAIDGQSKETLDTLARLFKNEAEGMSVVISYMAANRADEMDRVRNSRARYNYLKGYIPFQGDAGKSLRVVDNKDGLAMRQLGYTNIGAYKGSQLDSYSSNKSYFYSELPSKAAVAQGIMQNIHRTAGGVDPVTGYRVGPTAGRIVSRAAVANITSRINKDRGGVESLIPVFDQNGRVIAYERAIDPKMLAKLNPSTQLHELLGIWRGRQVEEMLAREANIETMKVIDKMYHDTVDKDPSRKKEFVNLMDYKSLDPVIQDMVDLFSFDTMEYIKNNLNGELWVRRDMLEDVTGYRQPSVSDFWTGISRWSPATREMVRDLTINMFGIKAYERLAKVEQVIQGLAADARTLIVVKSGIIPVLNFMSNIYHLLASGVPINDIVKQMPRKLVELRAYNRGQTRKIQLEVQIRASKDNPAKLARLRAEMRSINDSFKRLSIAPLIEAGEFSTVADVGDTRDDLRLSSGKIGQWLDQGIEKYLPPSLQSVAKIALVSKDTALFQGLQKSVQYGDFLAKAVLYDYHTKRKGMSSKESLGIITDEFVNYDRLPGRVRGGLENFGLLWFFNFKLRMVKVAASTLRNRPLYALLTSQLPTVPGAEMPIGDTIISKVAEGTLGYSVGPEMGFSAPTLNPWWNLTH